MGEGRRLLVEGEIYFHMGPITHKYEKFSYNKVHQRTADRCLKWHMYSMRKMHRILKPFGNREKLSKIHVYHELNCYTCACIRIPYFSLIFSYYSEAVRLGRGWHVHNC